MPKIIKENRFKCPINKETNLLKMFFTKNKKKLKKSRVAFFYCKYRSKVVFEFLTKIKYERKLNKKYFKKIILFFI